MNEHVRMLQSRRKHVTGRKTRIRIRRDIYQETWLRNNKHYPQEAGHNAALPAGLSKYRLGLESLTHAARSRFSGRIFRLRAADATITVQ